MKCQYLKEQGLRVSFRWRFPEESPPSQDVEALPAENLGGLKDWGLREYPPGCEEN